MYTEESGGAYMSRYGGQQLISDSLLYHLHLILLTRVSLNLS